MKGYTAAPLKEKVCSIGRAFEDCRYMNRQIYELGLEQATKAMEQFRSATNLPSENQLDAGNMLLIWKQLAPLGELLIM